MNIIEYDAECSSCSGTGLYIGFAEKDGAAIVCYNCNGTGHVHIKIEYEPFTVRKEIERGIRRVYQHNPGIGIGVDKESGLDLDSFGGMSVDVWYEGKPFPPKSEMRRFVCPAWWYQSVNYSKKPDWRECNGWRGFSNCSSFQIKDKCWERFDEEQQLKQEEDLK